MYIFPCAAETDFICICVAALSEQYWEINQKFVSVVWNIERSTQKLTKTPEGFKFYTWKAWEINQKFVLFQVATLRAVVLGN